jgi:hypothetical protein
MNPEFFINDLKETAERWIPAMEAADMPVPDKDDVLGCGMYGCAFGSTDPKIMVKYTTSRDEAEFMHAQKEIRISGIVGVHLVLQLGRVGFLIWRERLDACCDVAVRSLLIQHELPHENFDHFVKQKSFHSAWEASVYGTALQKNYESLLRSGTKEEIQDGCARMAEVPGLRDLANGLMDIAEYDLFMSDMHINNVGRFNSYDQLVVFDGQPTGDTRMLGEYPIPEV